MSEHDTLAELFARDPLQLTKSDRAEIIKYYRERRHLFQSTGASAKAKPSAKSAAPGLGLDLGELKL